MYSETANKAQVSERLMENAKTSVNGADSILGDRDILLFVKCGRKPGG